MTEIEVGEAAPDFCLPDSNDQETCLKSYRGSWVVLYFYPKDNTSGCTREAIEFTAALETLRSLNAEVLGISRDSTASHRKFTEKHGLGVKLLSDGDHKVMDLYGSWAKKKMYGREVFGTVRSTFLINPEGSLVHVWRSVKVNGHVENVVRTLQNLQSRDS